MGLDRLDHRTPDRMPESAYRGMDGCGTLERVLDTTFIIT